jgi:hypothetical protein
MKNVFILLITALCISSCFTLNPRDRREYVNYLDYQKYTSAGFFLSPTDYPGKYEPLGYMQIDIHPEIVETNEDYIYSEYAMREIPADELLESIVAKAIAKGANGISNLSIKRITVTTYNKYATTTSLSHYEVSGLLIMCK